MAEGSTGPSTYGKCTSHPVNSMPIVWSSWRGIFATILSMLLLVQLLRRAYLHALLFPSKSTTNQLFPAREQTEEAPPTSSPEHEAAGHPASSSTSTTVTSMRCKSTVATSTPFVCLQTASTTISAAASRYTLLQLQGLRQIPLQKAWADRLSQRRHSSSPSESTSVPPRASSWSTSVSKESRTI